MAFITAQEFDVAIKTKTENDKLAKQWRELPIGEIFRVVQRKQFNLKDGTCMILTLNDRNNNTYTSWATKRLCDELIQDYDELDVYIRSNGLTQSKSDPTRSYYDYDIIAA